MANLSRESPVTRTITWDQALFSFRFENYIPEGKAILTAAVRENVWEPLKLELISGYTHHANLPREKGHLPR